MRRRWLAPLVLTALVSVAAHASEPKKPKKASDLPLVHAKLGRFWMFLFPIELDLALGWAEGWEQREVDGALLEGGLALEPQLRFKRGRFRLRAPLSLDQRVTLGFSLPETRVRAGLVASARPVKALELRAAGRLVRRWRPGWADFYQPILGPDSAPPYEPDGLLETDRYGRTRLQAELGAELTVAGDVELELDLELEQRSYDHDPHYDPVLAPTHLVPNDLVRLGAALALRTEPIADRFHLGLTLALDTFDYQAAFARDAGTGSTHAGLGGDPANPLQSFLSWAIMPDASLFVPSLKSRLSLDLRWRHNEDRFQDYYTWDSLGGTLAVRVRPIKDVKVEADYALDLRTYTRSGYQASQAHAPLERGTVRQRLRHAASLRLAWSFDDDRWEPFVALVWRRWDDTMPDYEPWVNPPGDPYRVDFDADWWTLRVGVRLRL
jgi:hypothetical protein